MSRVGDYAAWMLGGVERTVNEPLTDAAIERRAQEMAAIKGISCQPYMDPTVYDYRFIADAGPSDEAKRIYLLAREIQALEREVLRRREWMIDHEINGCDCDCCC